MPELLNATEVMCFEREGAPPHLQLSAFPAAAEPGVRYFRGSSHSKQVITKPNIRRQRFTEKVAPSAPVSAHVQWLKLGTCSIR